MNKQFLCKICGADSKTVIDSYKHYWNSCNDCGNIFRERKEKYIVPCILSKSLAKIFLPENGMRLLYPEDIVIKEEEQMYDYTEASTLNVEETKWINQINKIKKNLEIYNISLKKKKVLDISGGPGFVGKELSKVAEKVVVTEFSKIAVESMIKNLNINVVKFDYQTDRIDEVLDEKFDVVFINYSINFCNDLYGFLSSLKNILHKGSLVFISFVPPTLGCCLRWQHHEYTYNILYQPETIGRIFAEGNFLPKVKKSDGIYYYTSNLKTKILLFKLPYTIWYTLKNRINRKNNINRELFQKNFLHIYEYQGK
jgi:2-polyprenyl-3-methyl-5-hydroxy-6-metoxy-1,4-benzoquinol methylase